MVNLHQQRKYYASHQKSNIRFNLPSCRFSLQLPMGSCRQAWHPRRSRATTRWLGRLVALYGLRKTNNGFYATVHNSCFWCNSHNLRGLVWTTAFSRVVYPLCRNRQRFIKPCVRNLYGDLIRYRVAAGLFSFYGKCSKPAGGVAAKLQMEYRFTIK